MLRDGLWKSCTSIDLNIEHTDQKADGKQVEIQTLVVFMAFLIVRSLQFFGSMI